ncbi:bifunctional diaminohydroxyphosphoribosylaminopyrimidine deaminase/5-amino-6-(5-phosphoribosylamino)uracil reductase RibD [Halovulum sp. GXIMD14793]
MDDAGWMRHALMLARQGLGRVWPNPSVGCVLVRDGRMVGAGRTADGGRPHAEAVALADAGDAARGATAYVTLEPCAHHGRTPPCADAMIEAGVNRVVVAMPDPDARVDGRGIEALRAGGVDVQVGLMATEAEALNAGFLKVRQQRLPMVTLKLAATLDGRIATAQGESRWITGPEARLFVHHQRRRHDAVMVGAGTARADNPMLDVRGLGDGPQPVRIVVNSSLSLSLTSHLAQTTKDIPVWLIHGGAAEARRRDTWRDLGATLIEVSQGDDGRLNLSAALQDLATHGLTRILCEGGSKLAAALIRAGLVDQLMLITAGKVIGDDGIANIGALGLNSLDAAPRFHPVETRPLGADIMTRWISATNAQTA